MFGRATEPFYNWAPIEPFERLGAEFVTAMTRKVNQLSAQSEDSNLLSRLASSLHSLLALAVEATCRVLCRVPESQSLSRLRFGRYPSSKWGSVTQCGRSSERTRG